MLGRASQQVLHTFEDQGGVKVRQAEEQAAWEELNVRVTSLAALSLSTGPHGHPLMGLLQLNPMAEHELESRGPDLTLPFSVAWDNTSSQLRPMI